MVSSQIMRLLNWVFLEGLIRKSGFCCSVLKLVLLALFLCVQREGAKCVFLLHGHITAVKSLSFCSSGLALVSGGIGGLLNIWSLQVRGRTSSESANILTQH